MTQLLEIERSLQLRGKDRLFSYLNLNLEAPPQAVRARLQKRRTSRLCAAAQPTPPR